jgi:hypothetical protein
MTRDVTLVNDEVLAETLSEYNGFGTPAMVRAFAEAEPTLATFLSENANRVVGKLALAGASRSIVQGVHADLIAAGVLAYLSVRKGAYKVWQDTELGERLRALEVPSEGETASAATDEEPPGADG